MMFRPTVETPFEVEGLEDRRLLSGSGKGLALVSLVEADSVRPEAPAAAVQSQISSPVGASGHQAAIKNDGEGSANAGIVQPGEPSGGSSTSADALDNTVSSGTGDGSSGDSSETSARAGAGSVPMGTLVSSSGGLASQASGSTSTSASQASGGAHPGSSAQVPDDESSTPSTDSLATEENSGIALSAAGTISTAADPVPTVAAPTGLVGRANSSPILAGGELSGPNASHGEPVLATHNTAVSYPSSGDESTVFLATNVRITPLTSPTRSALDSQPQAPGEFSELACTSGENPVPIAGDLASDFLPFDRATLERAIDRFLDGFDGLAAELGRLENSTGIVSVVTAVTMTAAVSQFMLRGRRLRDEQAGAAAPAHEQAFAGRPGLPNSWTWGLAEL
jgi:hypothetical protein